MEQCRVPQIAGSVLAARVREMPLQSGSATATARLAVSDPHEL